jgi:3-(3-hydroxy-phenyl)propionate hydroxylase
VHAFIELAVKLGDIIQATDPVKARERDAKFRAGQPEIFEFPSPRLGPGVLRGDTAPVGQPFPQPVLADGQLLDVHIGHHFAVIGRATVVEGVSDETRHLWREGGVVVMPTEDPALLDWLDHHGVAAIMLRPDRYIMGMARSPGELDTVTACLPVADLQPH